MVPNHCQSAVGLFAAGIDDKTQTLWVVCLFSIYFIVIDYVKIRTILDCFDF